jgi:signal transduction histidine kinase
VADLRAPSPRLVTGLVVVILGLIELQNLNQVVRWQGAQRRRAARESEASFREVRPQIEGPLREGGEVGWREALNAALRISGAAEAELFDPSGRRLAAVPKEAPVAHWPPAIQVALLGGGSVLAFGPVAGPEPRVLAYAGVVSGGRNMVIRLATAAPDLVDDLRERRDLLVGHAVALILLLVLGVLVLLPARAVPAAPPRALEAYVEAMDRLRRHGEAESIRHQSERQRMEDELEDRDAMVRAGELTAGMVHEVRNGLGTIVGYARMVEKAAEPQAAARAAARIREECETLETVVRRFMDFVKRETLTLSSFPISRMLARLASRESRSRPGAEIVMRSLPEQDVVGDEELLERAFENLVRNGCEAAGKGGHVWIDWTREEHLLTVTIADDGPGLSPAERQKLRPFFTTRAGGLGLGLPIALKIVRLHGGDVVLESRSPRGLFVRVRLPIEGPDTTGALREVTSRATAATSEPGRSSP